MSISLTPRTRNRLSLAFSALVFVAIGIGIFIGAQRSIADAALVSHTHEVIGRVDEIQARVLDAESAERGYLLTGNQAYLQDYQVSVERLPILLDQLADRVADNAVQRGNVQVLRGLVKTRLEQIQHILDIYEQQGLEAAQASIRRVAFRTTSAIREQATTMIGVEQELLGVRARSSRHSANLLLGLALAGIPFGLAVLSIVYGWLMRDLRRRSEAEQRAADANRSLAGSIERLEASTTALNQLGRYTGMLQSCITPEEALDLTGRVFATLLPGVSGTVYLLRASQDRAEAISSWGDPALQGAAHVLPEECWALRRGKPHLANDPQHDALCRHVDERSTHGATACLPMSAQGTQLGFLFLTIEGHGPVPHMEIAEAAAEQLSLALSNLRLRETLRRQSIRDPLTGLFNRRYLEESLSRELARCGRRGMPLSVLMLDVDHFKKFNDTQGHAGGDALLSAIGHLLGTRLRNEDIACRYGGEEFTVILPESGPEAALRCAEDIRQAVAALVVSSGDRRLPSVTMSIGIATFPVDGDAGALLMRRADAALYRAKRNGRDRAEHYLPAEDGATA